VSKENSEPDEKETLGGFGKKMTRDMSNGELSMQGRGKILISRRKKKVGPQGKQFSPYESWRKGLIQERNTREGKEKKRGQCRGGRGKTGITIKRKNETKGGDEVRIDYTGGNQRQKKQCSAKRKPKKRERGTERLVLFFVGEEGATKERDEKIGWPSP